MIHPWWDRAGGLANGDIGAFLYRHCHSWCDGAGVGDGGGVMRFPVPPLPLLVWAPHDRQG
jgi:hypothetical protein